jgi:hypothetical protein
MDNDLDIRLSLRIQLRHRVNKKHLQAHIKDAIENWGGQYHPSDELFDGVKRVSTSYPKVCP